jgi:hypothetical protein
MAYLPHQQRVIEDREDLSGKCSRLDAFLQTPTFTGLPAEERTRLSLQRGYMGLYLTVLNERIAAFLA